MIRRHIALAYQSLHETDVLWAMAFDGREGLDRWFQSTLGGETFAFGSARSALSALLSACRFTPGDQVIVCGFTCLAVAEAVLYAGLTPVYSDLAPGAWSSGVAEITAVASLRTRAVIIQHTYGVPHEVEKIIKLAHDSGWVVIEDCALALGATLLDQDVGRRGHAAIVSFEMTKTVTGGWGGVVVVNDAGLASRLRPAWEATPPPSPWRAMREYLQVMTSTLLFRPQLFPFTKYAVAALYRTGLYRKSGRPLGTRPPPGFTVRLARWQASLVARQLARLPAIVRHARHVTSLYANWLYARGWQEETWLRDATLLRFPLLIEDAPSRVRAMSLLGFELGRWFESPVAPMPQPPERVYYHPGSCPRSEQVASRIVNLPLHVRIADADANRILAALDSLGAYPLQLPAT